MTTRFAIAALAAALLSSAAQGATVSVMDGSHDVRSYGTGNAGLRAYGHVTNLFSRSSAGWADAIAAGDTIIVEQRAGFGAPIDDLRSFMSAGGRVIALGDFSVDEDLINPLFGTSLDISFESGSWGRTETAARTSFADDPETLEYVSSTHPVEAGALPAGSEIFYESDTAGVQVFRTALGSGDFFYIGHDYCCGSTDREDAYLAVLDSAISYDGGAPAPAPVPLPAGLPLLAAGLGGLAALRRFRRG